MVTTLVIVALVAVLAVAPSSAYLSDDQKEELIDAHNFYRSRVSPIATNMARLVRERIQA